MTTALTIGSLFSGIGGLELGLEAALGAETLWQVEQSDFCRKVLAKHWPDADRSVIDVHDAGPSTLPPVDLICGGFPCQDISVAGTGEGLGGAKSGLWREYERIIREMVPRFVVVENSPALTTRGLGVILGALAAMGYDADWGVLSAEAVGAPHRRRRMFIIGRLASQPVAALSTDGDGDGDGAGLRHANRDRGAASTGLGHDGSACAVAGHCTHAHGSRQLQQEGALSVERGRLGHVGQCSGDLSDTQGEPKREPSDQAQPVPGSWDPRQVAGRRDWWAAEPDVGRVAHGVPGRMDRLAALGNAVVPQVAYQIGLRVRAVVNGLAA